MGHPFVKPRLWMMNFQIYDENDAVVAVIGKKLVSITDKDCVDIYRTDMEAEVVAILIVLQHTLRDRSKNKSTSSRALDLLGHI